MWAKFVLCIFSEIYLLVVSECLLREFMLPKVVLYMGHHVFEWKKNIELQCNYIIMRIASFQDTCHLSKGHNLRIVVRYLLVIRRKDLCEARPKLQMCWNFKMSSLHLSQMDPQRWEFRSGWHFFSDLRVRLTFGQTYPPSSGIWWPSVVLLQVSLTFGQPLVRCTPSRGI